MYLSQSSIPKATEPGTVTPSGIKTATRLPACLVAKASSCWGIWKSRTSSGRSPVSRMPEVPVSPLMSIPCRWMTRLSAPSAFIPCGTAAIARPRWPLLPLPTPEMWPWSAPPQLSPIEPGRPSSKTRSTFPTFPSLTFALAASAVVTPAGSALAPAVTPSGAAWKEGSSNRFFFFFGRRRLRRPAHELADGTIARHPLHSQHRGARAAAAWRDCAPAAAAAATGPLSAPGRPSRASITRAESTAQRVSRSSAALRWRPRRQHGARRRIPLAGRRNSRFSMPSRRSSAPERARCSGADAARPCRTASRLPRRARLAGGAGAAESCAPRGL